MKRFTSCALALTLSAVMLLLSACGPTGGNTTNNSDGGDDGTGGEGGIRDTLVIANSSTIDEFDPQEVRSVNNMYGPYLTHMTLVEIDGDTKEVVGYLAESYEFDEATSSYIFHLHEDAVFSTGEPVTADDVVFTLDRAQDSAVSKPNVACVTGLAALDEHTVSVTVTAPSIEFLYNLAMANFGILSRKACEEDPEGYRVGCGPYTQIEWEPDTYTLYQRVEDYWNGTAPTKYIRYVKIAEASSRAIALQTGEIDVDMSLSASEVATIEADPNCTVYVEDGTTLDYLFFNVQGENEALKDVRVRQAIMYAINCEEIIIGGWEGYAKVSPAIPVASIDTSEYDCTLPTQNVEKAKELLAEAGYPDGFDMTIHHNSIVHGKAVEIIQSQLAQVGINMSVACADRTQMMSEFATRMGYESGMISMRMSNTPGSLAGAIYGTGQVANYTNYSDPVVDELLAEILSTNSFEDRSRAAYELNEALLEDCVSIPLFVEDALYGVRSNVKDLGVYDGSLYLVFRDAYVED